MGGGVAVSLQGWNGRLRMSNYTQMMDLHHPTQKKKPCRALTSMGTCFIACAPAAPACCCSVAKPSGSTPLSAPASVAR